MSIVLHLDRVMADRKMSLNDLAERVGITNVNMSRIKTGKIRAIRFSTLDALCEILECQPGEILRHVSNDAPEEVRNAQIGDGAIIGIYPDDTP